MRSLIQKRLITALAAISGVSAGITAAAGLFSPLHAQCGGGSGNYCESNTCNTDSGNCAVTSARYNCDETSSGGCSSSPCPPQ